MIDQKVRVMGSGLWILRPQYSVTTSSEHSNSLARASVMTYPSRRSLNSIVKLMLTDLPKYVTRFWRIDCLRLIFS